MVDIIVLFFFQIRPGCGSYQFMTANIMEVYSKSQVSCISHSIFTANQPTKPIKTITIFSALLSLGVRGPSVWVRRRIRS